MTQEFRLSVSKEMEKVPARILPPPELKYDGIKAQVRKGTWFLQKFNEAKNLERHSWTIVDLSGIRNMANYLQDFANILQSTG